MSSRRNRLREFYAKHLAQPLAYALLATVAGTPMLFLMTWAGLRGRFWGDPIAFTDAAARVPDIAAFLFVTTFLFFIVVRPRF